MPKTQFIWNGGDPGRSLMLRRPCSCGCDERDGSKGAGYLTGATKDGRGFTVWIESEEVYQAIMAVAMEQGRFVCQIK